MSPLHFAALDGHTETTLALVSAGAEVNAADENGYAPLHYAVAGGHTADIALALVSAGAEVNAADENGKTLSMYICNRHVYFRLE